MADISLLTSEVTLSVDILDFISSISSHFPSILWLNIYIYMHSEDRIRQRLYIEYIVQKQIIGGKNCHIVMNNI